MLELAARSFCPHVAILPEAATILFGGGFPRLSTASAQRAAQRAIFHAQRELERLAIEDGRFAMILCDRGTLDGLAYWPGEPGEFWTDVGSTKEAELGHYQSVLHLQTPAVQGGYNHENEVRLETPEEAHDVDERIRAIWAEHTNRELVSAMDDFPRKALYALRFLRAKLPLCCQLHPLVVER